MIQTSTRFSGTIHEIKLFDLLEGRLVCLAKPTKAPRFVQEQVHIFEQQRFRGSGLVEVAQFELEPVRSRPLDLVPFVGGQIEDARLGPKLVGSIDAR